MKRLVSTLNLSKEDWLRYRKCGITGTDAGAILDVNPYRSAFQIYHDKISDTIEDIDNEAMRQGRDLEDYVAQRFSEETGLKVRRANAIYQSEEHPLLLADFDRLIVGQKAGVTKEDINAAMKAAANESFGYNEDEIVSSDIVGMRFGSLFDATQTMVNPIGDDLYEVQVVSWYDNENSYTSQMVRTIKYFSELA